MRSFYLYKVSNTVNDKIYLGITCQPAQRWYQHRSLSSNCTKLKRAIAKYGVENFKFEVICEGSEEYVLDLEAKAITAYDSIKNGYNTIPGGNRDGISLEPETRSKISDSLNKYYEVNESPNKGRKVASRSDDVPVCAMGFWFPNARTAIAKLGINRKSFFKWKNEGTLHLEARPLKAKVRPKRGSLEDTENRSNSMKRTLALRKLTNPQ